MGKEQHLLFCMLITCWALSKVKGTCVLSSRIKRNHSDVTVLQTDQPCVLTLKARNNKKVVVAMYDMVADCLYKATVAIYDGESTRGTLLTNICQAQPWSFASRNHSLTFTPVPGKPLRPFRLDIHTFDLIKKFTHSKWIIRSERYPVYASGHTNASTTPNNFLSFYKIIVDANVTINVYFRELDVKKGLGRKKCNDSVTIYGINPSREVCGQAGDTLPQNITTVADEVIIEFRTDTITTYSGFEVSVTSSISIDEMRPVLGYMALYTQGIAGLKKNIPAYLLQNEAHNISISPRISHIAQLNSACFEKRDDSNRTEYFKLPMYQLEENMTCLLDIRFRDRRRIIVNMNIHSKQRDRQCKDIIRIVVDGSDLPDIHLTNCTLNVTVTLDINVFGFLRLISKTVGRYEFLNGTYTTEDPFDETTVRSAEMTTLSEILTANTVPNENMASPRGNMSNKVNNIDRMNGTPTNNTYTVKNYTEPIGRIRSERFLGSTSSNNTAMTSPNNFHSFYNILADENVTISIHFKELYVQTTLGGACIDFVKIHGIVSSKNICRGQNEALPANVVTTADEVSIEFKTDSETTYTGFEVEFYACFDIRQNWTGNFEFPLYLAKKMMRCFLDIGLDDIRRVIISMNINSSKKDTLCKEVIRILADETDVTENNLQNCTLNTTMILRITSSRLLRLIFTSKNLHEFVTGNYTTEKIIDDTTVSSSTMINLPDMSTQKESKDVAFIIATVGSVLVIVSVSIAVIVIRRRKFGNKNTPERGQKRSENSGVNIKANKDEEDIYVVNEDYDVVGRKRKHKATPKEGNDNTYEGTYGQQDVYAVVNRVKSPQKCQDGDEYADHQFKIVYDKTERLPVKAIDEKIYD